MLPLLLGAVGLILGSGLLTLAVRGDRGQRLAGGALVLGALLGLGISGVALFTGQKEALALPWPAFGLSVSFGLDGLSAFFLMQTFLVAGAATIYGLGGYPASHHPRRARTLSAGFGGMVAGVALLLLARDGVSFLLSWELMALGCFVALTTEDDRAEVREAGLLYLLATHTGTLCLFALFGLLFAASGTLAWDQATVDALPPAQANAFFLLALVGFGLKAGLMPLHVWLPSAHANGPTHLSAFMSGVLIKMGIYGLARFLGLFSHPPAWWGGVVLALGVASAVLGVLFALGQHDLKRLLAYHSIENVGIIALGLGLALLAKSGGYLALASLGFAGALLHTWNHGLFKALLFLSGGAAIHATGTRAIDAMGGLARRMPHTHWVFLLGAVAICGLPPLNGFVSEWLIYLGLFRGLAGEHWLASAVAAPALALVGGLALACFAKVYGVVFLGVPRSEGAALATEVSWAERLPMAALALGCVVIGLAPGLIAPGLGQAMTALGPLPRLEAHFGALSAINAGLLALFLGIYLVYRRRLARAPRAEQPTWGCGYTGQLGPRAQYTAGSFAQMLVKHGRHALQPERHGEPVAGLFAAPSSFKQHVPETTLERGYLPVIAWIARRFERLHGLQQGHINVYLLYVLGALVVLLGVSWS